MLIIRNNIIPFKGYKAVNLFGILFCRKNASIDEIDINHERIHTRQMMEMLYIPFYIWYGIEYLIRRLKLKSKSSAYRLIGFEREAYVFEKDLKYLDKRRHYAWFKFI